MKVIKSKLNLVKNPRTLYKNKLKSVSKNYKDGKLQSKYTTKTKSERKMNNHEKRNLTYSKGVEKMKPTRNIRGRKGRKKPRKVTYYKDGEMIKLNLNSDDITEKESAKDIKCFDDALKKRLAQSVYQHKERETLKDIKCVDDVINSSLKKKDKYRKQMETIEDIKCYNEDIKNRLSLNIKDNKGSDDIQNIDCYDAIDKFRLNLTYNYNKARESLKDIKLFDGEVSQIADSVRSRKDTARRASILNKKIGTFYSIDENYFHLGKKNSEDAMQQTPYAKRDLTVSGEIVSIPFKLPKEIKDYHNGGNIDMEDSRSNIRKQRYMDPTFKVSNYFSLHFAIFTIFQQKN